MPIKETSAMIAGMTPVLCPGRFVFCSVTDPDVDRHLAPKARARFVESEAVSLLLPFEVAQSAGLPTGIVLRQITLMVVSALDGIGLTAAVAGRLTTLAIPCNVIAATLHDHVFVPEAMAQAALEGLIALEQDAQKESF